MRAVAWLSALAWPLAAFRDVGADLDGDVLAAQEPSEPARDASGSAGAGASAGREGTLGDAASPPEAASPARGRGFFDEDHHTVILEPGRIGIKSDDLYITSVAPGSQADSAGLKAGDRFVSLNGKPYTAATFNRLAAGKVPYYLTVASPSRMTIVLRETQWYLQAPAGIMGFLLLLGMVPAYRSHQRAASDGQEDFLARCLLCPAVTFSMCALACSAVVGAPLHAGRVLLLAGDAAEVLYCAGLLHCLRGNLANPLFAARLPDTARARWQSENKGTWQVATVGVLLVVAQVATFYMDYGDKSKGVRDGKLRDYTCSKFRSVMLFMFSLEIMFTTTRIVGVVESRIEELKRAIPCKASDFLERAHAPCAELVQDTGPKLTVLGLPLLYLTMQVMIRGVWLYEFVNTLAITAYEWRVVNNWANAAMCCFEIAVLVFLVAVAPFRFSTALDDLTERLMETRCSSPELHGQIQAVESMLRDANQGQGWGIAIRRGIVLNKAFMQVACIRLALLATGAVAFIDSQLGLEQVVDKEITMEADIHKELANIRHMLSNATMPVHEHK